MGASLLSGPALNNTLTKKFNEISHLSVNLRSISAHDALIVLKYALSTPRILHLLRCSPCYGHSVIGDIDRLLRLNVSYFSNVDLTDQQWTQASLPIRDRGLGIRHASVLALPAFLSPAANMSVLQNHILLCTVTASDLYADQCTATWCSLFQHQIPADSNTQRAWDAPGVKEDITSLFTNCCEVDRARLLAVSATHSSDWLHALPIASCGLRLDNEDFRVAIGLRLGTAICEPHICPCGALIDAHGTHALSCKLGSGKHSRHNTINDIVCRSLARAGIPSVKEPTGLLRSDGKRPDGLTLIPWQWGKSAVWDVTIADTLAPLYCYITSQSADSAAAISANKKEAKYTDLARSHHFIPDAFESLGPVDDRGLTFLKELGKRMTAATGDVRETTFLFQRLSVAIQHFNYVLFKNFFTVSDS